MGDDFGKSMGDDMTDADLVKLDGMGMGGEMSGASRDQTDVILSEMEAEMNVELAAMDGMEPDRGDDAKEMPDDVTDFFESDF